MPSLTDNVNDLSPYGSASDLPQYQELEKQLKMFSIIAVFNKKIRNDIKKMRAEFEDLKDTIDTFYSSLGQRNWIAFGDMNLIKVNNLLRESRNAKEAEDRFIEYLSNEEDLRFLLLRLSHHQGLFRRMHLIKTAESNYRAGRFADTTRTLLEVIDGFVVDLDLGHQRGFHSRAPESMTAWGSIGNHHLGLTYALKTVLKEFNKTTDDEVYEVYRHGIVHGRCLNFDNIVVATKAWNLLFAISDWADAQTAKPPEVEQIGIVETLKDAGAAMLQHERAKKRFEEVLSEWQPLEITNDSEGFTEHPLAKRAMYFLNAWKDNKPGKIGDAILNDLRQGTSKKRATEVKELFKGHIMESYEITRIDHSALAVAEVFFNSKINGQSRKGIMRMILEGKDGKAFSVTDEDAQWNIATYGPYAMLEGE